MAMLLDFIVLNYFPHIKTDERPLTPAGTSWYRNWTWLLRYMDITPLTVVSADVCDNSNFQFLASKITFAFVQYQQKNRSNICGCPIPAEKSVQQSNFCWS